MKHKEKPLAVCPYCQKDQGSKFALKRHKPYCKGVTFNGRYSNVVR